MSFLLALVMTLVAPVVVHAQYTFLGPSKCVGCHDHDRQKKKWQVEEPALFKDKAHFNTRKQLEAAKAPEYAKAIGLADPFDVKGSCVKCHSTVFRGDANAGVSCESCHGAASNYNDIHQEKGAYPKAVAAGMRDLREKPSSIAKTCVECHLTTEARLAKAGHPTGASFDAGEGLKKLVHWNVTYNYAQVTAAAKSAMVGRIPAGGAPAPTPPAPAVAPTTKPAASPAVPPPAPSGAVPPASPPPPVSPPAPKPGKKAGGPPPPTTPAAPWDWDQPIRPLPQDYVPEPVEEPGTAPPPESPGESVAPPPATSATRRPSRPPPRPAEPTAPPPSIAEESPLLLGVPGAREAPSVAPVVPVAKAPPGPRPPAAEVAELRGRGAALLDRLLKSGARIPTLSPPGKPIEFKGPDGELLRLQDEVLALALEALRRPQP